MVVYRDLVVHVPKVMKLALRIYASISMNAKTSNMTVIGKRSALILKLLFNVFVKMVLQERFKMTTKIAITAVKIDFFLDFELL